MRKFVFDATPLIHLAKAGLAPLLTGLEGEKYTVPAVAEEVVGKKGRTDYPDAAISSSLIDDGVLKVKAPARRGVQTAARVNPDVHPGEAEVIALARELDAVAVIDDRVARDAARIQGVKVEGTYGVVLRAVRKGSLTAEEAEDALNRLVSSGWRCDAELYAALLRSVKEIVRSRR